MEKRLKDLLLLYCFLFLLLCFSGTFVLFLFNGKNIFSDFLISLSTISLSGGSFTHLTENVGNDKFVILGLMQCSAVLWLFFVLQFANIIGQSKIFHQVNLFENKILPAKIILRKALIYIFLLEAFFAITLYAFSKNLSGNEPVFWSVFNGISIVAHTGLSYNLYSADFHEAYIFQLVFAGLLITSRLGFPVFFDLSNIKRLRERLLNPEMNWTLQTRISIYITAGLLFFGCLIFMISQTAYFSDLKIVAAGISVFFNVTGWQGASFETVSPNGFLLNLLAVILMLAGLAPGSFGLLSYGLYANLFSKNSFKKVSICVLVYCATIIFATASVYSVFNQENFGKILMYCVSVFTNSGVASQVFLSPWLYAFLLLAGRIGVPVVLVLAYLKFCKDEKPSELMLI